MTMLPDELRNTITCAEALEFLKTLPDESVNCAVTSVPYYQLRDYGTATWEGGDPNCDHRVGRFETPVSDKQRSHGSGAMQAKDICPKCGAICVDQQIGLEDTLEEYIDRLVVLFHEMRRVLRTDGVFFLNIGDTYSGGNRGGNPDDSPFRKQATNHGSLMPPVPKQQNIPAKNLMLVPHRLAIALQMDGWIVRQDNIWSKSNPMPSSVTDRTTTSHEHVFLLTKAPRYWYDAEAVKEPSSGVGGGGFSEKTAKAQVNHGAMKLDRPADTGYRNLRSVWTIPTEPSRNNHYACVDSETECLTIGGWRRYHELKVGDPIFTFNLQTHHLEVQPILSMNQYEYKGNLVSVFGRNSNMLMTPNHRCVVYSQTQRGLDILKVREAKEIKQGNRFIVASDLSDEGLIFPNEPVEFFELLGWYISEGHVDEKGSVTIYQSESANPINVRRLDQLMEFFSGNIHKLTYEKLRNGKTSVEVEYSIVGYLARRIRFFIPDKYRIPEHFLMLPKSHLESFLSGFLCGDGHTRVDGRMSITQKSKHVIDMIQAMLLRTGKSCTLSQRGNGIWIASVSNRTTRHFRNSHSSLIRDDYAYDGIVWCPTVVNGTWVARRGGRPFITGNSFPTKLVEICLKAGCPETVCAVCGAPYVRVTEQTNMPSPDRPQGRRALELFEQSNLTQEHLDAIRAVSMADTGKALVTMSGAGKNTEDVQRLAAEAKQVLGGYYREFAFGGRTTVGFEPTCSCNGGTKRGIVLDSFMGSGRTAITAMRLNRDYIGCDLNPEYVAMALDATRLPLQPKQTPVVQPDTSKMPLFGEPHDG